MKILEHKEELLNEIIEWVSGVTRAAFTRRTQDTPEIWRALLEWRYYQGKYSYINAITQSNFPALSSLNKVNSELIKLIEYAEKCVNNEVDKKNLKIYENNFEHLAGLLLETAATIKSELLNNNP